MLNTLAAGPLDQFGAQSHIAASSPTGDTLRPEELGAGSDSSPDETESEEMVTVVILPGPRHPVEPLLRPLTHTIPDPPAGPRRGGFG